MILDVDVDNYLMCDTFNKYYYGHVLLILTMHYFINFVSFRIVLIGQLLSFAAGIV